ncbi:MAG: hypothetical protein D6780_02800, partial [Candidatus Dadabacteria bacterium]
MGKVLSINIGEKESRVSLFSCLPDQIREEKVERLSLGISYLLPNEGEEGEEQQSFQERSKELVNQLKNLVQGWHWHEIVMVLPHNETLFLNFSLPFAEPEAIQKVIGTLIADLTPFEQNGFYSVAAATLPLEENNYDIAALLLPNYYSYLTEEIENKIKKPLLVCTE